ncbi:hypothetical protein C0J52_28332 [Blattella germanica]|nr:hypothetical protein C0J52_28332 [Blattella germanica]
MNKFETVSNVLEKKRQRAATVRTPANIEARPHTANIVLDFLYDHCGNRVMSNIFSDRFQRPSMWPPHSPDINPCDYFLWRQLRGKIYRNRS